VAKASKRLWIDMCAGSELKDTQGETLSIEGCDISELEAGRGRFNDNHGIGFSNNLGMITEAKKIFKREDCDSKRQEYYWDKIKASYVYVKGYLHSDEDHTNAKAAAAILRNIHKDDSPLSLKASVEGGVIARGIKDPTRLARTKLSQVALTFTPANNATLVEPLNLDKSAPNWEADKQLIKSVMHLAETNVPSFRHIERHASANTIHDNILKIQELAKTVGIEIELKESNPDDIMKQAVMHKVSSNIYKINELVKALSETPRDTFQQDIGTLKSNPATPTKPLDDTASQANLKTQSASKVQSNNVFKLHASKAMRDPEHLESVHKDLISRGTHPTKAKAVIDKVRLHMVKSDESMEKGDGLKTIKNILVAGALAQGAHSIGNKSKSPAREPSSISREAQIHTHNSKIKDPDAMIDPKQYGYDSKKPGSKKDFLKRRKKLKGDLKSMVVKKALTAGYGGAGAPGGLTGGGVIQSESLDDGRTKKAETTDGITYISCDLCGNEQAYMQHQVKCRKCNKNFSLTKLQSHF